MTIVVIGAGVVGLSTAYWLARDGHAVTVVDANHTVGRGASFANGGQLSYDYVTPLADPGVLPKLPRWLLDPRSAVHFRLRADINQLRWAVSFLLACNTRDSRRTTEILLALAELSRTSLHECAAAEGLSFSHRRNGKLVFFSTAKSFERAARQKDLQAALGSHQLLLSRDDCVDVEPALKACASRITGAVYTPSEEVGDCRTLCEELYRVLRGPRFKVTFRLGFNLNRVYRGNGRIFGVASDQETVEGDLFVVCAGSGSQAIAAQLGIPLIMVPIRGYSISTVIRQPAAAPEKSITDFENKVVHAPVGGGMLRTAGFAEVGTAFDGSKVASLVKAVRVLFPGACSFERVWPWSGLRPTTPTGLPLVGRACFGNLLINVGHGPLGFTLASGSGKLIADLVAGRHVMTHAKSLAPAERAFKGQVHVGAQWADA